MAWRLVTCGLFLLMSGCGVPIGMYHDVEGGAIAQSRQPPPGADQPYPNLASVPAVPAALSPFAQGQVNRRLAGTASPLVSPASPGALAGLELPAAPPPPPALPSLAEPAGPARVAAPVAKAAAPAPAVSGAPVELAFLPGSAVLNHDTAVALSGVAAGRGRADVLVGGFGGAADAGDAVALRLGVARARRLADALTAAGVPPADIRMVAAAAGSGGFVQLVY